MKPTSNHFIATTPKRNLEQLGEEYFYLQLQQVWSKIMILEDKGIIQNEDEKFEYAYRFLEAKLQKVCIEAVSLHGRVTEKLASA